MDVQLDVLFPIPSGRDSLVAAAPQSIVDLTTDMGWELSAVVRLVIWLNGFVEMLKDDALVFATFNGVIQWI